MHTRVFMAFHDICRRCPINIYVTACNYWNIPPYTQFGNVHMHVLQSRCDAKDSEWKWWDAKQLEMDTLQIEYHT